MNQINSTDLVVSGVTKDYHLKDRTVHALSQVDFSIKKCEFISIIGPSGCGKSTLLRIIGGLEEPSSGSILVGDKEINGPGPDRGMVFQSYTLFPWLTVKKNIEYGLKLKKISKQKREEIVERYVDIIGLRGFENVYPKALSGGMKQRVAIARALANDPEMLLLDEPFGALDMQTRTMMQEFMLAVWHKSPKTIIMVTHDIEEAIFMADRVFVMSSRPGEIREIMDIDLPRPRDFMIKTSSEFVNYKREAMKLLHDEQEQTMVENA